VIPFASCALAIIIYTSDIVRKNATLVVEECVVIYLCGIHIANYLQSGKFDKKGTSINGGGDS
jgi:hypothetical protein